MAARVWPRVYGRATHCTSRDGWRTHARVRRGDPVTEGIYVTDGTSVEFGALSGGLSGGQQLLTEPSGRCIAGAGDKDPARRDRRLTGVDRPYVLVSCAMSVDGYIDDASAKPLRLSGDADLDRIDDLRAGRDRVLARSGACPHANPG